MSSALLNTGVSSSFMLMYSHLNLDDIYDLTLEEEISEYGALITHSKIHTQFPDEKKEEPSNHAKVSKEKMAFLV